MLNTDDSTTVPTDKLLVDGSIKGTDSLTIAKGGTFGKSITAASGSSVGQLTLTDNSINTTHASNQLSFGANDLVTEGNVKVGTDVEQIDYVVAIKNGVYSLNDVENPAITLKIGGVYNFNTSLIFLVIIHFI